MKLSMRLRLALVVLPGVLATVFFVAPAHAAFPGFLIKSGDPAHAGQCAAALGSIGVVVTRRCNSLDPTQQWTYNANNAQELQVVSGAFANRCAVGATQTNRVVGVLLKTCDGSAKQAWNLDASQHISGLFPSGTPGACWGPMQPVTNAMSLTSCSAAGNPAQVWTIVPTTFLIKSGDPAYAGDCAAVDTSLPNGDVMFGGFFGVVMTRPCNPLDPTQQWTYNANHAQELQVMSGALAGKCATGADSGFVLTNPFDSVVLQTCDGSAGQAWNLDASQHISGMFWSPGRPLPGACWGPVIAFPSRSITGVITTGIMQLKDCSTTGDPGQVWVAVPL